MIRNISKITGILSTLALMLACPPAMAGVGIGSITYAPLSASSIPTLSGAMLVVLACLFSVLAFRVLRAHSSTKPLASVAALGILTLGAASGIRLIQNAQAAIPSITFNVSNGGSVLVGVGLSYVTNNTGVAQQITHISVNSGYSVVPSNPYTPQCILGMIVADQGHCYISIVNKIP
jgi:hypothetical protein